MSEISAFNPRREAGAAWWTRQRAQNPDGGKDLGPEASGIYILAPGPHSASVRWSLQCPLGVLQSAVQRLVVTRDNLINNREL